MEEPAQGAGDAGRQGAGQPDGATPDPQIDAAPGGWRPPARSRTTVIMIVVVAVIAVLTILYAWRLPPFAGLREDTDNAYVLGKVTVISPQVSGYVTAVPVQDFAEVKAGQVLATIDDRIYRQKVEQANATLASQKASLANSEQQENAAKARIGASEAALASATYAKRRAEENWNRIEELSNKGIATQSDREQSRTTLDQAEAAVAQAQANLEVSRQDLQTIIVSRDSLRAAVAGAEAAVELAKIDLSNTVITAPRDGAVGEVGVKLGQYVAAGTQLMAVVPHDTWIIANFKETQLAYIKPGQPVKVTVEPDGGRYMEVHQPLSRTNEELTSKANAPLQMTPAVTRFIAHKDSDSFMVKQTLEQRSGMPERLNP